MIDSDCVWTTSGQRIVMVPTAIVGEWDGPFRLAEPGEAQTPAWWEDTVCLVHEETSFVWRPVSLDDLPAVEDAIAKGCDGGCHCQCHAEVAMRLTSADALIRRLGGAR